MELIQMMQERRSVRKYTGEAVPEELMEKILQAGLLSPTSHNSKPWEFIVVKNKETLKALAKCRVGSAKMLEGADAAVVVIANPEKTDVWVEDCSIAMTQMHLMADSLGVGSCWIQGRLRDSEDGRAAEEYIRELLGFPESFKLSAILSLGMPENHPAGYSLDSLLIERIHNEKY